MKTKIKSKSTVAIRPNDFIQYGCPCCCKFNVTFYDCIEGTRIMKCKKTKSTFHIVTSKDKYSVIAGNHDERVKVVKHPLGQGI